ncbi:condensation domain-containing protein [Streptomyces sp. NPDC007983]|uniref:condensation domain-containing protein n=1 Tax=Streptomyces sp. NPDC007983 TaxID=3364800 RepID=UPI0036E8F0F7
MTATKPLSVGQEALWFLHRMAPDSSAYNVAAAVRIRTALDIGILRKALAATAERHDMLRSTFVEEPAGPRRAVGTADMPSLTVHDVGVVADDELRAVVRSLSTVPLDLTRAAFRAELVQRADDDAVLLLTAHHIATDAYSQGIVLRDLLDAYGAGGSMTAEPLQLTWDDHVAAEAALLDSPRRDELEAYWRNVCTRVPRVLELPTDRPRPARQTFEGDTHELRLPEEFVARLRAAAFGAGVTPFVLLMAAFQSTLHRWTGQDDFLVGWPTTTRSGRRTRDLVGYFVNSLALRVHFEPSTTFADLFRALDEQIKNGVSHVAYPFALLPKAIGLPHDPSRPPITQVAATMVTTNRLDPFADLLAAGEAAGRELVAGGLRVSAFDLPQQEGQCDLSIEFLQSTASLRISFRYHTQLFERSAIERFARHFQKYAEAAVDNVDARVAAVSTVTTDDWAQLLALGSGATSALGSQGGVS